MAKNKWMSMLDELPGAVDLSVDPYKEGIRSPSPSVNFIFGRTHLIPFGSSVIFWGPPKGGKSLICNLIVGQLHKDYPDAIALKYNTELREHFQMDRGGGLFGIDPTRYRGFNTNRPEEIFDKIEMDVAAMCEKGAPIKLVVIDSITDILGRRASNADSVLQQQIGDDAATQTAGLKRIRSVLRKHGIALLMVAQERAELDPVQIMRHKKTKMAGAFYLQHFAEYFVYVSPNEAAEGRADIMGVKFENEGLKDVMGNSETSALKIKVQMKESSVGIAKRMGEMTFDKLQGLINVHEEVFRLGIARGVIERPNNTSYILKNWTEEGKEAKWTGKENFLTHLKANSDLQEEIIKRVRAKDLESFKNNVQDQAFSAASGDDETVEGGEDEDQS